MRSKLERERVEAEGSPVSIERIIVPRLAEYLKSRLGVAEYVDWGGDLPITSVPKPTVQWLNCQTSAPHLSVA